jgi:hypothetical protein
MQSKEVFERRMITCKVDRTMAWRGMGVLQWLLSTLYPRRRQWPWHHFGFWSSGTESDGGECRC